MNVNTLIEQVYYRIGRGVDFSSETFHTDILNALNTIQRNLYNSIPFQELLEHSRTDIALTANTFAYNLPTDFLKMHTVWNNRRYERELIRIYPHEYKNYLSDIDTNTSDVLYYDILDSSSNVKRIHFFPLLSAATTGSITAFADYSGTVTGTVLATDADHGLSTGDTITIVSTGGTFDGTFEITYVSSSTFYFTLAWPGATDTATWTLQQYIPFVFYKSVSDLSAGGGANILTTNYPDVYIEGAAYLLYRDLIYRDQPEKIAFRGMEYNKQLDIIKTVQRQSDKIHRISPKRLLNRPAGKLYTTQYSGYTS